MDPERRRAFAAAGGRKVHALGRGRQWTTEEARAAGKKGGGRPKKAKPEEAEGG